MRFLTGDVPLDATGQRVWIDGRPLPTVWFPPKADRRAVASPLGENALQNVEFLAESASLRASPFERWRFAFASDRLIEISAEVPGGVVDEVARSVALAWVAGLDRLYRIDADLNGRLRRALITAIDLGDGRRLPIILTTPKDEAALLDALLSASLSDQEVADRVRYVLAGVPRSTAWIIDGDGRQLTVGVANLRDVPAACRLAKPDGTLRSIAPLSASGIVVPSGAAGVEVDGRVLLPVGVLQRAISATPVSPPGVRLVPRSMLTLGSWLGRPEQSARAACVVWLERDAFGDRGGNRSGGWRVLYETRTPAPGLTSRFVLSGPRGRSIVRSVAADSWRGEIDLPPEWIDRGGILELGIEFVPHDGGRWTWPHATMPGQSISPTGRLDLSDWDGVANDETLREPSPAATRAP